MDVRNLTSLVGKLNDFCCKALEQAANLCNARTHYEVDIEHWLFTLNAVPQTDFQYLLQHYEIDQTQLANDLTHVLDHLKKGNSRTPLLSPRVSQMISEAWIVASIDFGATRIRSGHLLLALFANDSLARVARESCEEFRKIRTNDLYERLPDLMSGSRENGFESREPTPSEEMATGVSDVSSASALDRYTIDLTARARQGGIDPVLGREAEIRQLIRILSRRRQNNPILAGEAGVGKTAIVEGLALRIVAGDVPSLRNVSLRLLDLTLLQAGAGIRGEFENRLKSVISEVNASPQPIILFIDEAHTLIGAGAQAGQGDAANILKPALARGELRTIAATTWSEYTKYFDKDEALARRFQVVKVEEPTEEQAIAMLQGLVTTFEQHHKVRVLGEAVEAAVRLAHRYISGRQLPDKAVGVLDTACAHVALAQDAMPPALEDCHRRLAQIETKANMLRREHAIEDNHGNRLEQCTREKAATESQRTELVSRWEEEKLLVGELRTIRDQLEAYVVQEDGRANKQLSAAMEKRLRGRLKQLNEELLHLQGETPLVRVSVDAQAVAEVVSEWTGIPVGRMVKDEINTLLTLTQRLEQRVIGQSHALETIGKRIQTARARLEDPHRPVGVFLLVGPSGVGKTETARALAQALYGGDQHLTVINMSEFKEEHRISLLIGSPPGYIGYGKGGVLTESVRRRPYSVILLDEIEKPHRGVHDLFYRVFDEGTLRDGEGRDIDFRNTVILATSNAGTDVIMRLCADPATRPNPHQLEEMLYSRLLESFSSSFLGRMTVVPYYPISDAVMRAIIELQLEKLRTRLQENHRAQFSYDDALVTAIAHRCREVESGARNVDHILTQTLLPEISRHFLGRMAAGEAIAKVHVAIDDHGGFRYDIV